MDNLYYPLDQARVEISKRWNDAGLRKAVESELGKLFWPECHERPIGFISRPLLSPDNGFVYFYHAAHYGGTVPFAGEFLGDFFSCRNPEKCGLGQLRTTAIDDRHIISIIQTRKSDRKRLYDIVTHAGESLVDFHRRLFAMTGYNIMRRDLTDWYHSIGKPAEYYYPYLLHFVAHGALFEIFQTQEANMHEYTFTQAIVIPAIEKIKERYGLYPVIIRCYPDKQTDDESFFWWNYPSALNNYIIAYARRHKLPFKACESRK